MYITIRQSPKLYQMSLEDYLFGTNIDTTMYGFHGESSNTKTYKRDYLSPALSKKLGFDEDDFVNKLKDFNEKYDHLRGVERQSLYKTFFIPKKSKGMRRIDAPKEELMVALGELKELLETVCLWHTSAFAYIKKRSCYKCLLRHQRNGSRWFGKYDLSNFFGSTTPDYVIKMLGNIYPFSIVLASDNGREELIKALDLGFLNGGLPQGTPLSPTLTNIIMIPFDYEMSNRLRNVDGHRLLYTRYADDFLISSEYDFDSRKVEAILIKELEELGAPFKLKREKTRYGSYAGANWNFGMMLNKDGEITVGYRNHKRLRSAIHNFVRDERLGSPWDISDIQSLQGTISYYRSVERETINKIIEDMNAKEDVDILEMIAHKLKSE